MNIFGESKRKLSDKLYDILDDENEISEVCDKLEFAKHFEKVLQDYALVLKNGIIED